AAMSINVQAGAQAGRGQQRRLFNPYRGQEATGADQPLSKPVLFDGPFNFERSGIVLELFSPLYYPDALVDVGECLDLGVKPKAIKQLGPQLALFRVAGAHQDEPGRMFHSNPFALDDISTAGCGVQQYVYQVIVEQVDLVYI